MSIVSQEQVSETADEVYHKWLASKGRGFDAAIKDAVRAGALLALREGASVRHSSMGMTKQQLNLLRFIETYVEQNDYPPSFEEMKVALDLRSKSGIYRLITALAERGIIRRLPNRARAIEVVRAA